MTTGAAAYRVSSSRFGENSQAKEDEPDAQHRVPLPRRHHRELLQGQSDSKLSGGRERGNRA